MKPLGCVFAAALSTSWASSQINPPAWAQLFAFAGFAVLYLGAVEWIERES